MALPKDHPFAEFNEYYYLESGSIKMRMPIYIWKKGDKGLLVELYLNDTINGPRARFYTLIFENEYVFDLDRNIREITRKTEDELYLAVKNGVREVLNRL